MKRWTSAVLVAATQFSFAASIATGASDTAARGSQVEEQRLWRVPPQITERLMANPLFHVRQSTPTFDVTISRDGRRIAYAVWRGHKQFVEVDGQAGPAYDGIGLDMLIFSPDSK